MLDTIFSITALVGGTVLAFQFVMMLLGLAQHGAADMAGGHDVDLGGDGFDGSLDTDTSAGHHGDFADSGHWFYEIISIRTLSAAFTVFGLAGKTFLAYGHSPLAAFVYSAVAGLGALYLVYWLFKQVYRLQNAGNENVRNAIGLSAQVYVPIPADGTGAGKVLFRLQDRTVEYQAVTEEPTQLATGEEVVIVGVVNTGTVCVAREGRPVEAAVSG